MAERVVCIGDSITEGIADPYGIGWVGRLNQKYSELAPDRWLFTNLGVAGDTSADIQHRLISEAIYRSPQRLILSAGLNDLIIRLLPQDSGSRMSTNHSKQTWKNIFNIVKKLAIPCIVLGLTPVNEDKLPLVYKPIDNNDHGFDIKNIQIHEYERMLYSETLLAGLQFIPLSKKLSDTGYLGTLNDGLHPNEHGYSMIANIIMQETQGTRFFEV